uniref:Uncharacterized protein n=1 Tax=Chlamydomonas leiostraca TaxID=1034604 RepID=A0A7S0RRL2_9CHLO|mmetsp:Transcript_28724/g.73053  ORF Transcript_28724/g.73053 Transcript_28724/m.73053 type:complete len:369 (+) Transcript_28724:77-1183(+)|eukprot:CAMPEP_0202866560 /NCGR_PEP_ID=MMETSP1391-20130828/7951_1 /ASSEMBLY_ACC=CAM_ASM_000867 /TAXON_ID=1034604 /ORGANISM="Chlamydomonas leiostraca, Strain SAG 11-49" /LENGTH=368 /DNA_ID=CAMNT_0049546523 /DNA_START=64 /DNA_END=1170 /DNA_ORIENTATION=-
MATTDCNKLEFMPSQASESVLPTFDLRSLGAAFAVGDGPSTSKSPVSAAKLSGRCTFVVRQGFDPIDQTSTGRVIQGRGDMGITLRKGSTAISLTAGNLSYVTGLDDPLAAAQASVGEGTVPSLKATLASEYKPDCFAAASYDIRQKKPEFTLAWSGSTSTDQASLVLHADPLMRTYKLGASVAFPGPEWRKTVYNEDNERIEDPKDDGARHRLWVAHTAKGRQWAYATRIGAAFDLGRVANFIADFIDYKLEPFVPPLVWKIPGTQLLYNFIIPDEDEDQYRYKLKGWDAEVSTVWGRPAPVVGLAKHFKYSTLRARYDVASQEAALSYNHSGVALTAKMTKRPTGTGGSSWGSPSLTLAIEPLSVL